MTLRPYQQDALNAIVSAYERGVSRQLLVLPTGVGKSKCFAQLPKVIPFRTYEQLLLLVHRDELVRQAVDHLREANPTLTIEIEKADKKADPFCDIIVGSVQTLGRAKRNDDGTWEYGPRLRRFDPNAVRYVVADEAHHATSPTWKHVFRYFRCLKGEPDLDNSKLLLGVTATPRRYDSIGLEEIFDEIVYSKNIREMIADNWLVDIKGYQIWTGTDIAGVKITAGDFAAGDLSVTVNTPQRNRLVVDKYLDKGERMTAVAFTATVQHSKDLAQAFNDAGVSAEPVWGEMPIEKRREVIQAHKDGQIDLLASVGVLTEGWDAPKASVALMCRPTKSGLLYTQSIGRVLRPFPSPEDMARMACEGTVPEWVKPYAVVLDFVDNAGKHQLVTTPTLFGLKHSFDLEGKSVTETVEEIEELERRNPTLNFRHALDLNQVRAMIEEIDLFFVPTVPPEVGKLSKFIWMEMEPETYRLALPSGPSLMIKVDTLGRWELWRSDKGVRVKDHTFNSLREAVRVADENVPFEARKVLLAKAKWRKDPPTYKQCLLWYWRDPEVRKGYRSAEEFHAFVYGSWNRGNESFSKGAVSQRIDVLMAKVGDTKGGGRYARGN